MNPEQWLSLKWNGGSTMSDRWLNQSKIIQLLSIIIYRPFCKYICPLGAIYSIFNPISIFRYRLDKDKCINCGKCKKVCQMNIDPVENCNHLECIRCGRCKNACPVDAISYGVRK